MKVKVKVKGKVKVKAKRKRKKGKSERGSGRGSVLVENQCVLKRERKREYTCKWVCGHVGEREINWLALFKDLTFA